MYSRPPLPVAIIIWFIDLGTRLSPATIRHSPREGKLLKTDIQAPHQWTLDVLADMSEYFCNEGLPELSALIEDAKGQIAEATERMSPVTTKPRKTGTPKRAKANL